MEAAKTATETGGSYHTDSKLCGFVLGQQHDNNIGNIGYHVSRYVAKQFFGRE
jgi:hypothetical protein